jgi:ATP-dependent helicase STH1/SNF2
MTEPQVSESSGPQNSGNNEIEQHWRIVRQQLQAYTLANNDLPVPDTTAEPGSATAQVFEFPTSSILELIRKAQYDSLLNQIIGENVKSNLSVMTETKISESQRQLIPNKTIVPLGLDPLQLIAEEQRLENLKIEQRTSKIQEELPNLMDEEELRRKQIELKSLKLIPKQRMLREMILRFVRKTNILDSDRSNMRRSKKQSLREARLLERLEKQQKIDRTRKERQSYYEYLNTVLARGKEFSASHKLIQQRVAKLTKSVMHHHSVYEKEEQKRIEKLSKERIKALRADDEEAYLKLIDQEKDTRLTHLLRQTDEFLKGLTAKVVAQQSKSMATTVLPVTSNLNTSTSSTTPSGSSTDTPTAEDELIADYYETAHRIKEDVKEQPLILNGGKLKDYQMKGLQWMTSLYNNHLNGILADEMGLGKTIQTISLISHLMERKGQNGPFLVIVPLSTMTNWGLEFEKWAPSIIKVEYKGAPNQRKTIQQQIKHGKFNVMLTTYEYIIKDRSFLSKIKWLYMIIDEGHRMKNSHSKLTLVLTQHYSARFRLILTGTPLQNNLPELWALLNFILPHIFNSSKTFDEWFNAPFANTGEKVELNEEETLLIIRRLHKVLRPFLLRRLKKDVESELPDKVEKIIKCPMSALQQRLYSMITQRNRLSLQNSQTDPNTRKTVAIRRLNNTVMQLRKICNHPFVFEEVERQINPGSINNENLFRSAGKFELLQRILPKFYKTGHRVLIFFQMTQIMTIFEDFLLMQGYKYLRLDGSTKAEDRSDLLKKFNQPDSPYFIFMLSTRAGGLGLNLQTADTVIIFDSDWNPHQDLQAQDRAHRIGQTKEVRIFRLITVDSVEEYILERAQFKLNLDGKVIQAGKFDQKSTNEEREAILRAIFEEEQEKNDVDEVYSDDELNEIIARNDEELEIFRTEDEARNRMESKLGRSRLIDSSELPKVYMALDEEEEAAAAAEEEDRLEEEFMRRTRAKQEAIKDYNENISDDQWLEQLEESTETTDEFSVEPIKIKNSSFTPGQKRKRGRPPVNKKQQEQEQEQERGNTISFTPSQHVTKSIPRPLLQSLADRIHELIENNTDEDGRYRCDIYLELPSRQDYPDYYEMIKSPLCLNQVAERIDSNNYSNLSDLINDYDLIFKNAMTYNVEGSMVYEDALVLKQLVHDTVDTFMEEHAQELEN